MKLGLYEPTVTHVSLQGPYVSILAQHGEKRLCLRTRIGAEGASVDYYVSYQNLIIYSVPGLQVAINVYNALQ